MSNIKLKYHLPILFWVILTIFLSLTPGNELPKINFWQHDKILHFIFYTVMSVFGRWSITQQYKLSRIRLKIKAVLFILISAFSILIEILQGELINGRYFDIFDILANLLGTFFGLII
ncbi:MAG: VanZ family protein [Chitinophagales bacterium]|nr:VanZ family protein [Chitinophagales bacterium]